MFNQLMGMKLIVSDHATKDGVRVKMYPRCKARTPAHWRRMDKKWRKRYGFKREPTIYQMGDTIFAHQIMYARLRAQLGNKDLAGEQK